MNLSIFVVFFAGLLSFFSPCILPLIPSFLTLITGISLYDLEKDISPRSVLGKLLAFCAGFTVVFVILGVAFSSLGHYLHGMQFWADLMVGIILLVLALHMLKIFQIAYFYRDFRFAFPRKVSGYAGAMLVGMVFSLGWTPCVGPILGAVLALAGESGTLLQGIVLLLVYSAGLAIPFIGIGLFVSRALTYLRFLSRYTQQIERVSGIMIGAIALWFLYQSFSLF